MSWPRFVGQLGGPSIHRQADLAGIHWRFFAKLRVWFLGVARTA